MKFGTVTIKTAEGGILAHSYKTATNVLPKLRFKKGRVLSKQDCTDLQAAGVAKITIARMCKGDMSEDVAAQKIGAALECPGLLAHPPFTGRVNLYAARSGLFCVDRKLIDKINSIDSSITVSTLSNDTFVEESRLVATVKIIPFAVSKSLVSRAVRSISLGDTMGDTMGNPIRLYSPTPHSVGLIATCLHSLKDSVMDKTEIVLESRLSHLGSTLDARVRVSHDVSAVSMSLLDLSPPSDLIVIFGASAICDISDIIPQAIRRSGGEIVYFGMPVDPGNLLLLGRLGKQWIIGAPGCARSKSHNGFDWVLGRVLCGAPLDASYMSSLGVGGLLMEIAIRGQNREL